MRRKNLDPAVLELIRMLSNFETPQHKLLQIILAGQPPLAEKIVSPGLEQLRQLLRGTRQDHACGSP